MALRKDRLKPSHYPRLSFHLIRSGQLVSSLVVASILFFFLKELAHDGYKLPWTFILLFTISLLTMLALVVTIVLHCFYGLKPVINTTLNSALALAWAVSFSLLSWWSSGTLTHVCNVDNWEDDVGVSVCRLYKALFSFALLGLVSTLVALLLDVRVQRSATNIGRFQRLQVLGQGDSKRRVDAPELETNPNPTVAQRNLEQLRRGGEGYALPEEQFAYNDDTGYQGAAGQVRRRSLNERI